MKDKVEELSTLGLKTFSLGSGGREVFTEGGTSVGDCTVGESLRVCCL